MMWYNRDIKDRILLRLTDSTNGISAILATIDTERGETTPKPVRVNSELTPMQFPCVFIDLGDSIIDEIRGANPELLREKTDLVISVFIRDRDTAKLKNYCENYIEAIIRSLQNYEEQASAGSYYCLANATIRQDIDQDKDGLTKMVGIRFSIHRNKL